MKMKTQQSKIYGMKQKESNRGIYSDTSLPQETRKNPNEQLNFSPKGSRKRTKKTQSE